MNCTNDWDVVRSLIMCLTTFALALAFFTRFWDNRTKKSKNKDKE